MPDINFFEEYRQQQQKRKRFRLIQVTALSLITGLCIGTFIGHSIFLGRLAAERTELEEYLNDPARIEENRRNKRREIDITLLQAYEAWITGLGQEAATLYGRPGDLMGHFFGGADESIRIEQLTLDTDSFMIRGYAQDEAAMAQYKTLLDSIPDTFNVAIRQLSLEGDRYFFILSGSIGRKGGV